MSTLSEIENLIEKAIIKKREKEYSDAFELLKSGLILCEEQNNSDSARLQSNIYFEYGLIFDKFDDYISSLGYFNKSADYLRKTNDFRQIGTIELRIGLCMAKMGDTNASKSFISAGDNFRQLAENYGKKSYYTLSNQFYSFAEKMYVFGKNSILKKKVAYKAIMMDLEYYRDLCRTANLYNYSNNKTKAQSYAWRGLSISMDILRKSLNNGFDIKFMVNQILPYVNLCKNALLSKEDELTPVISLKIDELYHMFEELTDDIPDDPEDVDLWIETHTTSLQFMFPQIPPSFLFLTVDGRLFFHTEASGNYTRQVDDEVDNTLFAGVLSAIRFAFQEKISPVRGLIDEIKVGGETLLIENTEHVVVIIITTFIYPEVRKFLQKISHNLEEKFGHIIDGWIGRRETLDDVIEYITEEIKDKYNFN